MILHEALFKYGCLVISILLTIHLLKVMWYEFINFTLPYFVEKHGKAILNEKGEKFWVLRIWFLSLAVREKKK